MPGLTARVLACAGSRRVARPAAGLRLAEAGAAPRRDAAGRAPRRHLRGLLPEARGARAGGPRRAHGCACASFVRSGDSHERLFPFPD
eukprot:6201928-Pleurochrysis_carterae.AAC.1